MKRPFSQTFELVIEALVENATKHARDSPRVQIIEYDETIAKIQQARNRYEVAFK